MCVCVCFPGALPFISGKERQDETQFITKIDGFFLGTVCSSLSMSLKGHYYVTSTLVFFKLVR